jgi:hypothetical protein
VRQRGRVVGEGPLPGRWRGRWGARPRRRLGERLDEASGERVTAALLVGEGLGAHPGKGRTRAIRSSPRPELGQEAGLSQAGLPQTQAKIGIRPRVIPGARVLGMPT